MISDVLSNILEPPDTGAGDKILLIYILSRESEPTENIDEFTADKVTRTGYDQYLNSLYRAHFE